MTLEASEKEHREQLEHAVAHAQRALWEEEIKRERVREHNAATMGRTRVRLEAALDARELVLLVLQRSVPERHDAVTHILINSSTIFHNNICHWC